MKRTYEELDELADVVGLGLVKGVGSPEFYKLSVMSAVCMVLKEPHSDHPSCVAEADRRFAIHLNDANWSTTSRRGNALIPLALLSLDTAGTDRSIWIANLLKETIQEVLTIALELAKLNAVIEYCRYEKTQELALITLQALPQVRGNNAISHALAAGRSLATAMRAETPVEQAADEAATAVLHCAEAAAADAEAAHAKSPYGSVRVAAAQKAREGVLKTAIAAARTAYSPTLTDAENELYESVMSTHPEPDWCRHE